MQKAIHYHGRDSLRTLLDKLYILYFKADGEHAKEEWHNEFNNNIDKGSDEIDKMSDYQDQLNVKDETDTKS